MSKSIEKKIELLVEGGYFSKEDLKKEAFKTLLRERSDLRIALAVEEYKRGEITLNRAAEIAGVTTEEMKKKLVDRGISLKRGFTTDKEKEKKAKDLIEEVKEEIKGKDIEKLHDEVEEEADEIAKEKFSS